jgi:(R,R)-butanediol dehydrogenase/meso-butanediol dehydrogenase/diacetyl reductase
MAQCDRVAFLGTSWTGGALAEAVNLYEYQCYKLPEVITDEAGALVEPFSAAVRAIHRNAPTSESQIAVVGAGPIGLMAILAARIFGVKSITAVEVSEPRIDAALGCGANEVINPSQEGATKRWLDITNGQGFDLVVECAGQPTTALLAAQMTRTRGTVSMMGVFDKPVALDLTDVVFREKTIVGSMSGYGLYPETIHMMEDVHFQPELLITDQIGLDDLVSKGYHSLLERKGKKVKTLVRPN